MKVEENEIEKVSLDNGQEEKMEEDLIGVKQEDEKAAERSEVKIEMKAEVERKLVGHLL